MQRTHEDIQDELLVLECQDGDEAALRVLIGRWQPRLAGLAWRLTADREGARDVVQDAWLAIIRGIKRLDDPARFRSWAFRIVTNRCVDWTRRRTVRRGANVALADARRHDEPAAGASTGDRWEADPVLRVMAELPDDQRAILALHYLEGMGIAEIAGVLRVPAGTVKSRLYHARNGLKRELERNEP
jgi:RNA polymerase sigma-70 factor (ECF subfamily)